MITSQNSQAMDSTRKCPSESFQAKVIKWKFPSESSQTKVPKPNILKRSIRERFQATIGSLRRKISSKRSQAKGTKPKMPSHTFKSSIDDNSQGYAGIIWARLYVNPCLVFGYDGRFESRVESSHFEPNAGPIDWQSSIHFAIASTVKVSSCFGCLCSRSFTMSGRNLRGQCVVLQ